MVELAEAPAIAETLVGIAVTVKSVTWKRIDAVTCDSEPIVPVTVTV
jgi:hypothetical protein